MATATMFRPFAWAAIVMLLTGIQSVRAAPLVYVPLGGDAKIVVADAAKDKIGGTGKLYVSRADNSVIWVIDDEALVMQREISIGGKASSNGHVTRSVRNKI